MPEPSAQQRYLALDAYRGFIMLVLLRARYYDPVTDRFSPGPCTRAWSGGSSRNRRSARSPADPCHTTVRTGPYTAVRDGYATTSNNDGSPSDLK